MFNENKEIWHKLLSLESSDVVAKWFNEIHSREPNTRRIKEITCAAKQSREYFRNAANSDYSVKPLLTFYGVASLSRSLILLLKKEGGEETLKGSHGLETLDWSSVMGGDLQKGTKGLGDLKIRTTQGLFTELIKSTNNRTSIHINSEKVDWSLNYPIPAIGANLTLGDLCSRLPDLRQELDAISVSPMYSNVSDITYNENDGFSCQTSNPNFQQLKSFYEEAGYKIEDSGEKVKLSLAYGEGTETLPLFIHAYIHKIFGKIPVSHISKPFSNSTHFSQLGCTYLLSYILGMLVRYYPTHWVSISSGSKGDLWWTTLNRAQQIVEETFPELVIELIEEIRKGENS